jgi:hypothetical protein
MAGVAEKTVKGPDGRIWEVGRLWFHRTPRPYKRKRFNENTLELAGLGVAARVLFRRPWKVVVESDDLPAQRFEIPVVGYRAAGAKVDEIVYQIQETGTPFRA